MSHIRRLSELENSSEALAQLKEIFFLTSNRKEFSSDLAREEFYRNWTSYYLTYEPDQVYMAFDDHGRLLGYLTGCLNSLRALDKTAMPSLKLFSDLFREYPAHLHINCHPSAQGQGVGSALCTYFFEELETFGSRGVHIVTSPAARNVEFYRKQSFNFTEERELNGAKVLFMGRKFSPLKGSA